MPSVRDDDAAAEALRAAESVLGANGSVAPGQATRSSTKVEVEHLDYGYVGKCNDGRELERIYAVLKSGKEGKYPDLEEFTRKRLEKIKPGSETLKITKPIRSMRDLDSNERNVILGDLNDWTSSIAKDDNVYSTTTRKQTNNSNRASNDNIPPVRGQAQIDVVAGQSTAAKTEKSPKKSGKAIPGSDFRAWDKFNVDAALEEVDKEEDKGAKAELPIRGSGLSTSATSKLESKISRIPVDPAAKRMLALSEKDKGNECFRAGDMDEAIIYYTRSLSVEPIPATRNNRALVQLKLKKYLKALEDLDAVLADEPENIKALVRRATALKGAKRENDAREAAEAAIRVQPNNKDARKLLSELTQAKPSGKKKRMVIEEVDGDEEADSAVLLPPEGTSDFIAAQKFTASKSGYVYKQGAQGLGYYKDTPSGTAPTQKPAKRITIEEDNDSDESDTEMSNKIRISSKELNVDGPSKAKRITIEEDSDDSDDEDNNSNTPVKVESASGSGVKKIIIEQDSSDSDDSDGGASRDIGKSNKKVTHQDEADVSTGLTGSQQSESVPEPYSGPSVPQAAISARSEGNSAFGKGHYGDATELYTKALVALTQVGCTEPEMTSALLSNRAACHMKNGNCRQSVIDCDRALELDASNAEKVRLRRAAANEAREKFQDAYADYDLVLSVYPANKAALDGMRRTASILRQMGETPKRTKVPPKRRVLPQSTNFGDKVEASTKIEPRTAPASKKEESKQQETNSEQDKLRREAYTNLKNQGNKHYKNKKLTEAKNCYDRCVELSPNEAAAYNNRALCFLGLGEFKHAVIDTNSVLRLEPKNSKAMYRKAQAKIGLQEYSDARQLLQECIELQPNNVAIKKTLADLEEKVANTKPNDVDAKLQELNAKKQALEAERAKLQRQVLNSEATVAAKNKEKSSIEEDLSKKDKQMKDAQEKIKGSVDMITKDVSGRLANENDKGQKAASSSKPASSASKSISKPNHQTLIPTSKKWTSAAFIKAVEQRRGSAELAADLKALNPSHIPRLFSNRLEGDHVIAIFKAAEHMEASESLAMLEALTNAKRFSMISMFVADDPEFVKIADKVFVSIETTGKSVDALRSKYIS